MLAQLTRLLRGNRELSTFLVCVALSFVCFSLPPAARDAVSTVLSGVLLGPVERLTSAVVQRSRVREENEALRLLALGLMQERGQLLEHRLENERLRELMGVLVTFPQEEYEEMLPARVTGLPGGRVVELLKIDRGLRDSLAANMPVVVPDGLVGKVARVYRDHSLVEPLTSASSGVSVITERGRVRGVLKPRYGGSSAWAKWEIDFVQARSDVLPGDLVVTSGLGGVYPSGIVVGRVVSAVEGPLRMSIEVDPAVDFSTLEQVFVLTGRPGAPIDVEELKHRLLDELGVELDREDGIVVPDSSGLDARDADDEVGAGRGAPERAEGD